jgi:hypothetical protein
MKTTLTIVGFTALASALAIFAADLVVTEYNAPGFYRDFTRLTKKPRRVSARLWAGCASVSRAVREELKEHEMERTGPHFDTAVHLYANSAAMPAVTNRLSAFPVGAVIVKEKLADEKVLGIGGMIKRAPGYDAPNGDWEYFYYGKPGEFSSGRLRSCIDCHRAAKTNDYVYSIWSLQNDW